jgi:hypothetical protein
MKNDKIVWVLQSLGELEAMSRLIAETSEEEAKWVTAVAVNTNKNKGPDRTLECVKKACAIHALARIKKKLRVRFPERPEKLKTSTTVCTDYYRWRGGANSIYLEDLAMFEKNLQFLKSP